MYKKKGIGWLKHIDFIIVDLICIQLAFALSYVIRFGVGNPYASDDYRNLAVVYLLIDVFVAVAFDSFKNVLKRGIYKEFVATIKHVLLVEAITLFYLFSIGRASIYSRISFYLMVPIYVAASYVIRIVWKKLIGKRELREEKKSLLIVAPYNELTECIQNVQESRYSAGTKLGAVVTDKDMKGSSIAGTPIVAQRADLIDFICREWVDEVIIYKAKDETYPTELVSKLHQMGVISHVVIANTKEIQEKRQLVERIGGYVVMTSTLNYATPGKLFAKRLIDIAGGLAGSLITLILIVILGPIIYINSPGPIFFAQERIGRNGRKFKMYKFRTMYMDAEERKSELMSQNKIGDGMMFKMDFDPRIIGNKILPDGTQKSGAGQLIRKLSLDEFPQFWNIFKGDMSLVGTRPPTLDEWEKYEPHHRARMAFRPGLTGMWQVSGRSNITDFEEVVKLDTEYIDDWDIGLDVKIILQTVRSVFKKDGAM